jgi:excisionase family DNA binding protein
MTLPIMTSEKQLNVPDTSQVVAHSQPNTMQEMSSLTLPLGELLTVDDVARCFKVSKLTVYRLVERQILPAYRFCRHLRFKPEDVKWYLDQHQLVHPTSRYASKKD